jgi:hypothetical protein
VPGWQTIASFSGNGQKKTSTFNTGDHWRLLWQCKPSSFYGGQYNVIVEVMGTDGSQNLAVNTICKSSNTGGDTEEYQNGTFYLDVNSEAQWSVQIQEFN